MGRDDPALVFIDPKGWKGAELEHVSRMVSAGGRRDVIVNAMWNFMSRFRRHPSKVLREQIAHFFAMPESEVPDAGADDLFAFYRRQLKQHTKLLWAADAEVPHPEADRTWFRLIVGTGHHVGLSLFRDAEAKVMGREASKIRDAAKRRKRESRTGQTEFALAPAGGLDPHYDKRHQADLAQLTSRIPALLEAGPRPLDLLWPPLLEDLHIQVKDVRSVVHVLEENGVVVRRAAEPRRSNQDILMLRPA